MSPSPTAPTPSKPTNKGDAGVGRSTVALFVDFDNVSIGLHGTGALKAGPQALARVFLNVAARFGRIAAARVYVTDPRRASGAVPAFNALNYVVVVPNTPRYSRNVDQHLALDCQEMLFTRPEIDTYVLASGDSDFLVLAQSIRARDRRLVVVAPRVSTSTLMIEAAQDFLALEDVFAEKQALDSPGPATPRPPAASAEPKAAPARRPALRVFLCHSKSDKKKVRKLYDRLNDEPGVRPWLDEKDLVAGQEWDLEITKAVKKSHCVVVCLSASAVGAAGYMHKEIKFALDVAETQPDGTIFLIPLKFDECDVPERLGRYHWVDFYRPDGYANLIRALQIRANALERST